MNPQNPSKKVFTGKTKSNETVKNCRVLPVFHCQSCGNCETRFFKDEKLNEKTGFCLRFKETVLLAEKNISCWTKKENTYYKDLFLKVEKQKTAITHIEQKKAEQLNLFFDNENPFNN
ncbi:hypothetical protein SAMN05192550_2806 [Flavobacterium glycines]|uniref:Uncharacterized protein n=1 Tax=Flavobacterium glycines TaxID=551990 RepID=A0A1B9DSQ3_9FLAO|nr:hypothetical protein [Flavobacterium glycines]OCB72706.1 hypothetical protein FBGL_05120 [Flavobacterium glycines]GEL11818.1 hypothetical protein FGL01_25570 [Flavobacterium glycines]SDJ80507.1 hypothetical protein SAMN05192550_2806 [Flavobacterium glycines]